MGDMKNELLESSQDEMMKALRKELKFTRVCSLLVATLLVFVIVGGFYVVNKITPALAAIEKMQPAIAKIEQLDIEVLNEKIEQLDIEGLNKIVEDLDVEALSEVLRNINEATAYIEEIGKGFSDFSESVTDSFNDLFKIGEKNRNGV
ncbi:MAG: hypothetical protein IKU69_05280 [Roseburia sp.]|nr:hypothetical protein [Roseburia sp.]